MTQCKEATAEPVRHGACLGLGLAAMGTARADIYEQIKQHLFQDDAITGGSAELNCFGSVESLLIAISFIWGSFLFSVASILRLSES